MNKSPIISTERESEWGVMKPSMARAPRKSTKVDIIKTPKAVAGVHYEVLDMTKHAKLFRTNGGQ